MEKPAHREMAPEMPLPRLETERLILRQPTISDAEDKFEYASLPEFTEYLSWDALSSVEEVREKIQSRLNDSSRYQWAIELKENGKAIGDCNIGRIEPEHRKGSLGYELSPEYQGQGLATEALQEVIKFGFEKLGLHRIDAVCDENNDASWRLMERLGDAI